MTDDPTPSADVDALLKKANSIVESISALADKARDSTDEIIRAREKADTSSSRLADIVTGCADGSAQCSLRADEARATGSELASLLTQLQTRTTQANETIAQASASLETVRTLTNAASESVARIDGLKTKVEQDAEVAAQRSDHIEDGRKYVDEKRREIDVISNNAQQSATSAESHNQVGRKSVDELGNLLTSAQSTKSSIDGLTEAVRSLLQQCEGHTATTKNLAATAQEVDAKVKNYEDHLAKLAASAVEQLKKIESLLPGAAAAGLASAFGKRRAHFQWPMRIWQGAFICSLLALIAIAWFEFGLFTKPESTMTWDHLALLIVHRLPFMLPLIWLAFYASTKAALAQRVEEDYAFKETVSRSFEGYRKEMADLEGKTQPQSTLDRLCSGVLGVVTSPPGRIYEKHPLVPQLAPRLPPTDDSGKRGTAK